MAWKWHIFPQVTSAGQVGERIGAGAHVATILNNSNYLHFVLGYLIGWSDHFTTATLESLLSRIKAELALADTPITFKNTFCLLNIIWSIIWHPFSLLDEPKVAVLGVHHNPADWACRVKNWVVLNDIFSGKQRGVAANANVKLLWAITFILLCVLTNMTIESCGDIFEHIVTDDAITIKESSAFIALNLRRFRYTSLWIDKL